jgi:hypothetical protein
MKSIVLLAATLYLLTAPTPDSADIAEMTSNLIVPEQNADMLTHFIEYLG